MSNSSSSTASYSAATEHYAAVFDADEVTSVLRRMADALADTDEDVRCMACGRGALRKTVILILRAPAQDEDARRREAPRSDARAPRTVQGAAAPLRTAALS